MDEMPEVKTEFLPAMDLGVLAFQIKELWMLGDKRKREREFKHIAKVLQGLRLVPRESDVTNLSWGVNRSGEVGLSVSFYLLPQVRGASIPGIIAKKEVA